MAALLLAFLAGIVLAGTVTALLSLAPLIWIALIFAGLAGLVPALIVRDPMQYWLALFLLTSMTDIKKTLLDGLEVMDALGLVAVTPTSQLVPEIRLSDLVLVVLLLNWAALLARHRATLRAPRVSLFVLGLLSCAALSSLFALHPYLGFVEITNMLRYFTVFLYVVNNIRAERTLVLIGCMLLLMLTLQSGFTMMRYAIGFGPLLGTSLGRTQAIDTTEHLNIERGGGGRRGYGTVLSPRGTGAHLLLLLPWSAMVFLHTRRRWLRLATAALFAAGVVALLVTYSRSATIGLIVSGAVGLVLATRWGKISRRGIFAIAFGGIIAAVVITPAFIAFLNKRPDNVDVRVAQFRTAAVMLLDNFVLGVGPNNSAATQRLYAKGASSSEAVTDPTKKADIHPIHSQHLANLVELGIVGFAFYMGFFVTVMTYAGRLALSGSGPPRVIGAAYLLGTIGLFVQFLADPIFEHSVLVLLWFLSGLVVMVREDPPREWRVAGAGSEATVDELPWLASRRSRHATTVRAG